MATAETIPGRSGGRLLRRLRRSPSAMTGAAILLAMVAVALLAPLLAPHDPFAQDLSQRLVPPFWMPGTSPDHLLGTDNLGRDYLSRLLYGARYSLGIGFSVALIAMAIGTTLGLVAGYFGGRVDEAIQLLITWRLAMPVVLIALAAVVIRGPSISGLVTILGLLLWDRFAVVIRSTTIGLRKREFVAAARVMGASHLRIMLTEILPNLRTPIIVLFTLEVAQAMMLEAALSFLGLGVPSPLPSWGLMIAEAREFILFDNWLIALPGMLLVLLVFSVNLLGDSLRDLGSEP